MPLGGEFESSPPPGFHRFRLADGARRALLLPVDAGLFAGTVTPGSGAVKRYGRSSLTGEVGQLASVELLGRADLGEDPELLGGARVLAGFPQVAEGAMNGRQVQAVVGLDGRQLDGALEQGAGED